MTTKAKAKKVIVRTYSAGVHYGTLTAKDGREVTLTNSRRVWYWTGAASLSQLAVDGPGNGSKISVSVEEIVLLEAIEILTCTPKAAGAIEGLAPWRV